MFQLKCIFTSDLHGNVKRYESLFRIASKEKPDAVFLGGDLLPNAFSTDLDVNDFIDEEIILPMEKIKNIKFFLILGNDDPRIFEKKFLDKKNKNLFDYVNENTANFNDLFVTGYCYVPPTPFQLKDWEKYDVSRFIDVGVVPPEAGIRTINIPKDEIQYSTIAEDLEKLSNNAPVEKTIFLFHSPPYKS